MTIVELESSRLQDGAAISEAVESIVSSSQEKGLIFVAGIGATERRLVEAGQKSAGQDLVLASTLAEGARTFLIQVAHQLTSDSVSTRTQSLLSELFNEFSNLLEGVYLIGELSPQAGEVLASYAERVGAIIMAQALQEQGLQAQAVCGRQIHLANSPHASENFHAKILADFQNEISALSQDGIIPVIPISLRSLATPK
jgi:aspartokinase